MPIPDFKFLKDAPIRPSDDGYFDFYHKHVAPSIKTILENDTCVHTVGLFGAWGTGKSTIIKALKEEGISSAAMIEFDCWKYQKESLQRQLLLQIAKELGLGKNYVNNLIKQFYYDITEPVGETVRVRWNALKLQLFFPITLLAWMAVRTFAPQWTLASVILFSLAAIGFVVREFLIPEESKNLVSITTISGTKNKIDSPELFEQCFAQIITDSGKDKVIIVVDNLDRVEKGVAIEMLSTLKTFLELDANGLEGKKIIFLVPCHYEMLRQTLSGTMNPSEYLRKIFNLAIWSPEFINTDLDKYIESLLEKTGDIKNLINTEDVILVIKSSFVDNPREIKQFINNFIASVVIALNTEVAAIIKDNPAYMAKLLVLRDKFPKEYAELKEQWFAPESIGFNESSKEFRRFMLLTNRITTSDAEPYLYFKKPILAKGIKRATDIRLALLTGEVEKSVELIRKEKKNEAVADYVVALINAYKTQKQNGATLVNTALSAFFRLEFEPTKREFYNTVALALDEYLWERYKDMDQSHIFSILRSPLLDTHLKTKLTARYAQATEGAETVNNLAHAKAVFSNVVSNPNIFSADQKALIAKAIDNHHVQKMEIMSLLDTTEAQQAFLNDDALNKFINYVSHENYKQSVPVLLLLKDHLYKKNFYNLIYNIYLKFLQFMANNNMTMHTEDLLKWLDAIFDTYEEVFKRLQEKQKNVLRQHIDIINSKHSRAEQEKYRAVFSKVLAAMNSTSN